MDAQGLQPRFAAHGLQPFAAHGLQPFAAQGFFAAHGFFAAQGLQPFFPAMAVPTTTSGVTAVAAMPTPNTTTSGITVDDNRFVLNDFMRVSLLVSFCQKLLNT